MKPSSFVLALAELTSAQVAVWGQCGGIGYTGSITCASGSTCIKLNDYFSQCQPGTASTSTKITTTTRTSTTKLTTTTTKSSTIFSTSTRSSTSAVASPSGYQYLGRVNPATKELSWPGTGVRFSFNGNASIPLTVTGSNSGQLVIDGTTTVISTVTSDIPLPSGSHNVEFRKRSEAGQGSIFLKTAAGVPAANKLIEFIGDSITVGYGLDGVLPCTNTAQVTDNPKTYAALTANALGADYNIVASSGKGIMRNYPGDEGPTVSEFWTRYGANDADDSYTFPVQAQVVVINVGTNDFAYLGQRDPISASAYQQAIVDFVGTIKMKYPAAAFFLLSSPMLSDGYPTVEDAQHTTESTALQNAAKLIGAHFVDWPTQGSDVGCDYHPNAATHAAEAEVLTAAIKSVLGW